jgi:hypothetical protein
LKRSQLKHNRERLNAGIIAATIVNCAPFGDADRKAVSPLDYVPDWQNKGGSSAAPASSGFDMCELTPEQQRRYLLSVFCKKTYTPK